ncbi:MAG: D-amino-acid transaminase [Pirellulaceae bacterium]|nr:D-amino-acid transaminase [Pirellulaceae bacterium]
MKRWVYVNGNVVTAEQAVVSVFDRGFLMADAVYEVTAVLDGKLIDFAGHCQRLARSLSELEIANPHTPQQWLELHRQLVQRNQLVEGLVYLQISRGNSGDRDFAYPPSDTPPTVVMFTQSKPGMAHPAIASTGLKVITVADIRWGRRDIKTVQLLYPAMAKMMATKTGADEAWFVQDGLVTEGTSNNAYILRGQVMITRQLNNDILHGTTRGAVLQIAHELGLAVEQRGFSVAEALQADEAFITSASAFILPVVELDGQPIGSGRPGANTQQLRQAYIARARQQAI